VSERGASPYRRRFVQDLHVVPSGMLFVQHHRAYAVSAANARQRIYPKEE
jgi:hypothetical protein